MPSKMKTCEDYRTALTDAAADVIQPPLELCSHLEACASCHATFVEEMQLFAAIDSGVRSAANAEVPASLLPRVRVQLNERPVPRRSWVPAFAAIAAVAALIVAIVFVHGIGRYTAEPTPQVSSASPSASSAEIRPDPPVVGVIEMMSPRAKNKTVRAAKTAPLVQAEEVAVLIPAGQKQAMDALLAGVRQGQVKADVLLAENSEETLEELQVSPIDISPIEMKPLGDIGTESPAAPNERARH
jgi:anti-sigma factor RsiW